MLFIRSSGSSLGIMQGGAIGIAYDKYGGQNIFQIPEIQESNKLFLSVQNLEEVFQIFRNLKET